jgi:translation initiation factor 3 subunit C
MYQRIRVLLALVSARFDHNSSISTHMPTELWVAAQSEVEKLITILATNPEYSVEEITAEYDELAERTPATEADGIVRIRGSIISFVERLDDEFTKSLQNIDPHGTEYVERLRDEKDLYRTICRSQGFYEKSKQEEPLGRVVLRRLEHIYSKVTDQLYHQFSCNANKYRSLMLSYWHSKLLAPSSLCLLQRYQARVQLPH